jgi:ribosomal protein S18 acetylase RimI-like enzyme
VLAKASQFAAKLDLVSDPMRVRSAGVQDIDGVASLFDQYRQFYGQSPDAKIARAFIAKRMGAGDSVVLVAESTAKTLVGFVQLYRSYSSVRCRPIWILSDLFVDPARRRSGVGEALMNAAREVAQSAGAAYITLAIEQGNEAAHRLYRRLGYRPDDDVVAFMLDLTS